MRHYNTREASEMMGLTYQTLVKRRQQGKPPKSIKTKGRICYQHADLCQFVDGLFSRAQSVYSDESGCDKLLEIIEVKQLVRKAVAGGHLTAIMLEPMFPQPIILGMGKGIHNERWSHREVVAWCSAKKIIT